MLPCVNTTDRTNTSHQWWIWSFGSAWICTGVCSCSQIVWPILFIIAYSTIIKLLTLLYKNTEFWEPNVSILCCFLRQHHEFQLSTSFRPPCSMGQHKWWWQASSVALSSADILAASSWGSSPQPSLEEPNDKKSKFDKWYKTTTTSNEDVLCMLSYLPLLIQG